MKIAKTAETRIVKPEKPIVPQSYRIVVYMLNRRRRTYLAYAARSVIGRRKSETGKEASPMDIEISELCQRCGFADSKG